MSFAPIRSLYPKPCELATDRDNTFDHGPGSMVALFARRFFLGPGAFTFAVLADFDGHPAQLHGPDADHQVLVAQKELDLTQNENAPCFARVSGTVRSILPVSIRQRKQAPMSREQPGRRFLPVHKISGLRSSLGGTLAQW